MSLKSLIIALASVCIFSFSFQLSASEVSLFEQPMANLKTGKQTSIANFKSDATIGLIFRPKCGWCRKQVADFDALVKQCPAHFNAVLIGISGNRQPATGNNCSKN